MNFTRSEALDEHDLADLADLERRVVAHDGGRLKLETAALRRSGPVCLLHRDGGRLVAFAGRYAWGSAVPELAGAVDPAHRRRGIGTALLSALLREPSTDTALLVVPRTTGAGERFAEAAGGVLDHSEHALLLESDPTAGPSDPSLTLRPATTDDVPAVRALLVAGFGDHHLPPEPTAADLEDTLVAERDGRRVATLRAAVHEKRGSVYGFVVEPALRGRGLGADVLRRACVAMRRQGATEIALEVEADNDRALGLYTRLGFRPVVTEDYYRLR